LFTGSDFAPGIITFIRITTFPSNTTTITINGLAHASGTFPTGGITIPANTSGNPTQSITVDPIDGNVTVAIPFVTIDNASRESSPATVSLPFTVQTLDCTSSICSNFNGTPIAAGKYIWFNSVIKVSNVSSYPVTITFTSQNISSSYFSLSPPTAVITINASGSASTTFSGGQLLTVAPAGLPGYYFLSGYIFQVPAGRCDGLPGGINPVCWQGEFSSNEPGVTVQWKWAAAVYKTFSNDYNALGIKPIDASDGSIYHNSDHAGTPENYKSNVIGGARGGGGSNYAGSYTGTVSLQPCITPGGPACIILDPQTVPFNFMTGNTISVDPASINTSQVASYNWTLTGSGGWLITAGSNGPNLTYTAGTGTGTFTLTVLYTNGTTVICSKDVTVQIAGEYCTLTQGYWGNSGGNFCNTGTKVNLLNNLLGSAGLTVGYGSNNLYFAPGQGQCIIDLLPGGGSPARISGTNTCANHPGIQIKNGRINNILLAQTITLALNMRLSTSLDNLILDSPTLVTAFSDGCLGYPQQTPNPYHPVAGTIASYIFNSSVYTLLKNIYGTTTPSLANLLDLANKALGNFTTSPPITSSMLSPINTAVTMINEKFDGCKWGTFQGNGSLTSPVIVQDDPIVQNEGDVTVEMSIIPNPVKTSAEIRFMVTRDTRATIEIYNFMGVKISTLYDYRVNANEVNSFDFTVPGTMASGIYLCTLRTEYGINAKRMIVTH
jgi:hypothetical protein